jgi:hypothetical protein
MCILRTAYGAMARIYRHKLSLESGLPIIVFRTVTERSRPFWPVFHFRKALQMTDFITEVRHRCRNPRCRSKLPTPVVNEREAFCARGCHTSFYLHRCLVCERAIEQPKRGRRLICKKAKCKRALQAGLGLGRYHPMPNPRN